MDQFIKLRGLKVKENKRLIALVVVALLIAVGGFRVYYGGGIGFKVVPKNSYSFTDTIVNLDDLFVMPRIAVASQHPAVKRQLEEMGVIKTDEEMEAEVRRKIMKDYENEIRRIQFGY